MINLDNVLHKHQESIDDVNNWAEEQYSKHFAEHFKDVNSLYARLKSTSEPITDSELEWILTWLPIELMNVSEKLSELKNSQEVIKLEIKQEERKLVQAFTSELSMSETKAKERAAVSTEDDKLMVSVYESVHERASRQVTFAKELIMSSKKIWDARRNSEQPMPSTSSESLESLPEYDKQKPSTYVK